MLSTETTGVSRFAMTNGRGEPKRFGIKQADRLSHMYVVGKTGTGKSTLLHTLARQDLLAGRGFCLIDPHGDLADKLAAEVHRSGRKDVIYWKCPIRPLPSATIPSGA